MEDNGSEDRDIPLVVDLDGTLCRTDTLHEALLALARETPSILLRLPGWLSGGRADFKAQVANRKILRTKDLPLNPDVIQIVEKARAEGRRTILASAAHMNQVRVISEDTGLFDDVVGSTAERNLKGAAKARHLVDTYGEKGFDYIGDSVADLEVWSHARAAFVVGASGGLKEKAAAANPNVRHIPALASGPALWRAIRPHQWVKNILVFVPVLAAHDLYSLPLALLAFAAFSLVASSAYLVNDLLDLAADRAHPRKCSRPFASGDLALSTGLIWSVALLLTGLMIASFSGALQLLGVVAGYFAITLAYSFWLKRKLIVDILTLAGLYTIRIVGGGAATATVLSPWMLGFSVFLFLCLAAIKRQAELMTRGENASEVAGRAYAYSDLPIVQGVAISAAHASVLIFALYINSEKVRTLYPHPELLWLVCPLLLYWTLRMVMKTHRGEMTDDPIIFAMTDRTGLIQVIATIVVIALAAI